VPNRVSVFSLSGEYKSSIKLAEFVFSKRLEVCNGVGLVEGGGLLAEKNELVFLHDGNKQIIERIHQGEQVKLQPPTGPSLTLPAPYAKRDHWALLENGS